MTVRLGLGLIGIGRPWGAAFSRIPDEGDVEDLLREAIGAGVTFFDTAPSYGSSEKRLGDVLSRLPRAERNGVTIATKFGECWNKELQEPYVDHSLEGLRRSLDNSIGLLGRIDVLQVHKATIAVLKSSALMRALEYARQAGIGVFGASVSDTETALVACEEPLFSFIQFPYNMENSRFESVFSVAEGRGKQIIVNRPLNMGAIIVRERSERAKEEILRDAFSYVVEKCRHGIILTGTTSVAHLRQNVRAFRVATDVRSPP